MGVACEESGDDRYRKIGKMSADPELLNSCNYADQTQSIAKRNRGRLRR
jgi:hypothetical protein